ncbi:hypothetical protein EIN_016650 [Entamoeba invadens IP1]|uniref:hypothetical protein n=1 Tax=Entamoeba invadens IP1 TaxID=370355 RepID=UPI0002C3D9F7|nr:hypothetical protein EIN_016650 [Entamoeba invadens IP1]ELP90436.1 hypothetical protein EIN_016650 [Entamoeba invadens IP1]|eukprot:XP_004257207.1 hypothetical protein EIN_016650 [Entamoeba invadens IP1]
MSPVDPPTRCQRLTYWFVIFKANLVNFLSKYIDIEDFYKSDYVDIARKINLVSCPSIVVAFLTFAIEKPLDFDSYIFLKMKEPLFKMFFLIMSGIVVCLNPITLIAGVMEMAGGLFYTYLFYKGELIRTSDFIVRVTEDDISNLDGILPDEQKDVEE